MTASTAQEDFTVALRRSRQLNVAWENTPEWDSLSASIVNQGERPNCVL